MTLLDTHRLRFTNTEREGQSDVMAIPKSLARGNVVTLGRVQRIHVSTDSKIAGTRLRRRGKGKNAFRAIVPATDQLPSKAQLQGCWGGGWRLELFGEVFNTRREAAEALAEWHESPERRQPSE